MSEEEKAAAVKGDGVPMRLNTTTNPPGTLVALGYVPGFGSDMDLTSWVTRVSAQGDLSQEVLWHRFGEPRRIEVTEAAPLSVGTLNEVKRRMATLQEIDQSARNSWRLNTVDDAQMGRLFFPDDGFFMDIPLHEHLADPDPSRYLSEDEIAAVVAFEALWDLIDEHCPQRVPRFQSRPWPVKNVPPVAGD